MVRRRAVRGRPCSTAPAATLRWARAMGANTKHYGVGVGPMANLLRIIRDYQMPVNVTQIYAKAVETEAKVRMKSWRHPPRCTPTARHCNDIL